MSVVSVEPNISTFRQAIPPLERYRGHWQCGNHAIQMGLSDEQLAMLYQHFRAEGTLDLLFYERPVSMYEFQTIFLNPKMNTIGAFIENEETMKWDLCGFGFVRDIIKIGNTSYSRADVGEGFLRDKRISPIRFVQMMLAYAFDALQVSVVSGITPVHNRAACIFPRKVGFAMVGPLPGGTVWQGQLCDVMLSAMTKSMWEELNPWKDTKAEAI